MKANKYKIIWNLFKKRPLFLIVSILTTVFETANSVFTAAIPMIFISSIIPNGINYKVAVYIAAVKLAFGFFIRLLQSDLERQSDLVSEDANLTLSLKLMKIRHENFEDSRFLKKKDSAVFAINQYGAFQALVRDSVAILSALITVFIVLILLAQASFLLFALFALSAGFMVFVSYRGARILDRELSGNVKTNQMFGYFVEKGFSPAFHKDARVFNLSELLLDRFEKYRSGLCKWIGAVENIAFKVKFAHVFISELLVYAVLIFLWLGHRYTVVELVFFLGLTRAMARSSNAASQSAGNAVHMINSLQPFFEILTMKTDSSSESQHKDLGALGSLSVKGLNYTYPGSNKQVLNNISFDIAAGDTIAIVGPNGSGKSTLAKLLCSQLTAEAGSILWNNMPISDFSTESYAAAVGSVFQDFRVLPIDIASVLGISGVEFKESPRIKYMLDSLGIYEIIEKHGGLNSVYGVNVGVPSVKFSKGQEQKLAIARAILKSPEILILDEPTASLDPISEAKLYSQILNIKDIRTKILITHRLKSVEGCDKILVLNEGRVDAYGTHDQVIKNSKVYRDMFESQKGLYD